MQNLVLVAKSAQFDPYLCYIRWTITLQCVDAGYHGNVAAAPPLALKDARCDVAADYTKKKNVIRLTLSDQSEYLFVTHDPVKMNQWQTKIQFHAGESCSVSLLYIPPCIVAG